MSNAANLDTHTNTHATIRAMSGATVVDHIDPAHTALLVIDFQQEYFAGRMPIPDGASAMRQAQHLLAWADQHQMAVVQVQHIAPEGSAVFALQGDTMGFVPEMAPRAQDLVVQKRNVSVFVGTDIDVQLRAKHIQCLVIAGLMTHACVAGAARDAAALGYQVIVASDACATRTIVRANGDVVDSAALHSAALAEIEDTFGDVLTTQQIMALATA